MADADFPLQTHLGMEVLSGDPGDGRGVARIELDDRHLNPNGVAHGAVVFAMVDTAMGKATMEVLADDQFCASIEVQLHFLRSVSSGALEAEATVLKHGRNVVFLDARVHDDHDRLVAVGSGSFAVLGG